MAEKTTQEIFDKREKYRKEIRGRMVNAYNSGDVKTFRAFQELLEGNLQYEFKELINNRPYTKSLTNNYFKTHGEQYDGNITKLIEDDFEHWNLIEGSLLVGGKSVFDAYTQMDEETKKNNATRWKAYINTSPVGEYSRDFDEQFKGVAKGVGVDIAATAGYGLAANLTRKAFGKQATRTALTTALSTKTKVAGTGALYGMTADVERQTMEMGLGTRDEYDIGQGVASTVIGAVAPTVVGPAGRMIGKAGRAVTHPLQSASTFAKTITGGYAATSAARGTAREAGDVIENYGASVDVGASNFQSNLNLGLKNTHTYYQSAFDAIPLENINPVGIRNIVQRWNKTTGMVLPDKAKQIMAKLDGKTITPIEALRELKKVLYTEGNDMASTTSDKSTLFGFRKELINIEEIAALNQGMGKEYMALKKSYGEFQELLKTPMGKKILAASDDPNKAGALIKSMALGDFSWNNLRQFQIGLNKTLRGTGQDQTSVNLNKNIQNAMGGFLKGTDGNYKNLVTLLNSDTGLQTLKRIYPKDKIFWESMEELSKKLPASKGGSSSVVMNMAIARVGANIGTDLTRGATSAQLQKIGPIVGAIGGISVVNKLVDTPFFQNAMIKAYKRAGGTLDTTTKAWLKNKGYSRTEINSIQDTLWGLTGTGFALGSLDEIWEKYEDPTKRKIEEIKAGYIW